MATFSPKLFRFLDDLAANNDRDWFKANQATYEAEVRQPALDFITEFAEPLARISPHLVADSRTVGGSLFRIQRDTRFSKDKTPYKLNTGMHFRHEQAEDAHAPGFYVHLQPRQCFIGAGLWQPESRVAYEIRAHIDTHPQQWLDATRSDGFTEVYQLAGESLVRPPRGFDADHPLIDDLKRKSFIATAPLTQRQVTSAGFSDLLAERFQRAVPMVRFLCDAVGVPF